MKKFVIYLPLFAVVSILSGCAGKDAPKEDTPTIRLEEFSSQDEAAALNLARNFAGAFEKSLISGDFKHLEPILPMPEGGKKFSATDFSGMRKAMIQFYGIPRKIGYAATLQQGKLRDVLWKITFERQKTPGVSGEFFEILLCVRIFREPGKTPEIAGFFIKRF